MMKQRLPTPLIATDPFDLDDDSFTDYLMYKPDGGVWVTLSTMEWNWSATVDWVNGQYVLSASQAPPPSITGMTSWTLPVWTGTDGGLNKIKIVVAPG